MVYNFYDITGQVINMTAPVATKVLPGQGPNCNSYFTMSFYIPYGNQANPPQPTSSEVFLEEFPATTIYAEYVLRFWISTAF